MAKVSLRSKKQVDSNWNSECREFTRIPEVGEYVTLSSQSPWYKVLLVVHTPYKSGYDAEMYVVEAVSGYTQTTELLKRIETLEYKKTLLSG